MAMTESEVTQLALDLMAEHNLNWPAWGFKIVRAKLYLGRCTYNRFNGGMIEFSKNYFHLSFDQIKDVLLHEIAHAIAGHAAGHGPEWKSVCRKIGAMPNPKADLKAEAKIQWKWTGVCPVDPSHTLKRHALTDKGRRMACGKCCRRLNMGVFDARYLFEWHLTSDLEAAGRSGVKLITQPEPTSQRPTRITDLVAAGF
jgi:predicted SprT family Zn-dependent metalloprotease